MKNLITLIILLFFSLTVSAQKSNAIYGELLGNGLLYSINYDFSPFKNNKNFRTKIGLGAVSGPIIITQASYLLGNKKHFLELGAGVSALIYENTSSKWQTDFVLNAALQYRFESSKGFLLRIGLAPTFFQPEPNVDEDLLRAFWLFPGASLGYAF